MPSNEVGDRIHNFFGQENLSQGQHHSQVIDGTWPGLNNNFWVGGERQIGSPLISNLKNYSVQQSGFNHTHLLVSSYVISEWISCYRWIFLYAPLLHLDTDQIDLKAYFFMVWYQVTPINIF